MRDLQDAAAAGNDRARLAVDAYCYSVRKEIGAMASALGGIDALAFAGGIGERGTAIRTQICQELEYLGVSLNETRNAAGSPERELSSDTSPVKSFVVTTDEESIVARAAVEYLEANA
jgi:acetate kinase